MRSQEHAPRRLLIVSSRFASHRVAREPPPSCLHVNSGRVRFDPLYGLHAFASSLHTSASSVSEGSVSARFGRFDDETVCESKKHKREAKTRHRFALRPRVEVGQETKEVPTASATPLTY